MTLNKFYTGPVLVFAILVIVLAGGLAYQRNSNASDNAPVPPTGTVQENAAPPTFTWTFEDDDTLNLDGNPRTNVILEATYRDGTIKRETIDTVDSSCNELPENDADSIANTKDVQCYGAGLGFRYKITKGESSYVVMRQMFEEALPDTEPVQYDYVVVAGFPF